MSAQVKRGANADASPMGASRQVAKPVIPDGPPGTTAPLRHALDADAGPLRRSAATTAAVQDRVRALYGVGLRSRRVGESGWEGKVAPFCFGVGPPADTQPASSLTETRQACVARRSSRSRPRYLSASGTTSSCSS